MAMWRYEGRLQIKLITSIKMAVSLCVIMLSLVAADSTTGNSPESPVTTLPPEPTTTMLPHSEDDDVPVNVTARVGSEIFFDCRIPLYEGHVVAWSYVNPKSGILSTQTVNKMSFGTHRTSSFQAPNNYRLQISSVNHEDEGLYYCLFISSLKQVRKIFLEVTEDKD